jgi:hypothetical protein
MLIFLVIAIIVATLILGLLSAYVALEKSNATRKNLVDNSGVFSLVRESPRKYFEHNKPTEADLTQFLDSKSLDQEKKDLLFAQWSASCEHSIRSIERADRFGVETFGLELGGLAKELMPHITAATYLTREMIFNHAELLPPYFLGDTSKIVHKDAMAGENKNIWEPLLPVKGSYQIPEWRNIDETNS